MASLVAMSQNSEVFDAIFTRKWHVGAWYNAWHSNRERDKPWDFWGTLFSNQKSGYLDLKMRYSMRYHILAIPDRCKGMIIVPETTKATLEITQDTPNIMDPVH